MGSCRGSWAIPEGARPRRTTGSRGTSQQQRRRQAPSCRTQPPSRGNCAVPGPAHRTGRGGRHGRLRLRRSVLTQRHGAGRAPGALLRRGRPGFGSGAGDRPARGDRRTRRAASRSSAPPAPADHARGPAPATAGPPPWSGADLTGFRQWSTSGRGTCALSREDLAYFSCVKHRSRWEHAPNPCPYE
jgi:hypothetical protein